ncbi:lipase [Rhizobium lusitanum]|nr:lipase [Rhizobium lusitanum]
MKKPKMVREPAATRRSLLVSGLAFAFLSLDARANPKSTLAIGRNRERGRPEVYLLRGLANIFSTGLDEIGRKLQADGIDARVEAFTAWRSISDKIVGDRQKYGKQPIALVGHSLGANAIISLAEELDKHHIQVDYIASFAATSPDPLPGNVKRAVNFYFASRSWGLPLSGGPRFAGRLENRDCSGDLRINHFNVEKQSALQDSVVRDIRRVTK